MAISMKYSWALSRFLQMERLYFDQACRGSLDRLLLHVRYLGLPEQ